MRIVQISDLHFWHVTLNPVKLAGKRLLGMTNLILNRAWKYRMSTMPTIVARIREIAPDHLLVTGDLTTTALEQEFAAVSSALATLGATPGSTSVIPGNHDRYTRRAAREHLFERHFAALAPSAGYPWLKWLDDGTALLGLDPTHPNVFSAEGTIAPSQLDKAQKLIDGFGSRLARLVVACHYPVAVPPGIVEARGHGLRGAEDLRRFLRGLGPNLYCCGHIHATWCFTPTTLPRTLCLNPGAALKRNRRSGTRATLLEIELDGRSLSVRHHRLRREKWEASLLLSVSGFF